MDERGGEEREKKKVKRWRRENDVGEVFWNGMTAEAFLFLRALTGSAEERRAAPDVWNGYGHGVIIIIFFFSIGFHNGKAVKAEQRIIAANGLCRWGLKVMMFSPFGIAAIGSS